MLFLIERERGSKTAPFTLSLPGARLSCVRHRRRTLYGVPGRFVGASVPCELVSKPLAASLLLTHCGGSLGMAWSGACSIERWSRCARELAAVWFRGVRPCGAARRSPYGAQHRRAAGDLVRHTGQRLPPQGRLWCVRRTGFTAGLRCLARMGDRKTARREPGGLGIVRFFGSSRCACRMLGEASPLSRWCNA